MMIFEGGYPRKQGEAMDEQQPAGRGLPADVTSNAPMPERLAGMTERIADRPDDAPVVVSAGFLRWLAREAGQAERNAEQRDEARTIAKQQKARADAAAKLLTAADSRMASLRGEIAALTGRPAGIEWKFGRVTAAELADYELAGWDVRQMEIGHIPHSARVALRRVAVQRAAAPIDEAVRDTKPIPMPLAAPAPAAPEMATAASIEARLPQKQIDMLLAVRDGADIIPRHAGTRRALREAGLVEVIGKPAEWKMTLTPMGAAVLAAYRMRKAAA